jgi:tight adherence protein B
MNDRGIVLVSILIFAAIFIAGIGILVAAMDRRKQKVKKRLENLTYVPGGDQEGQGSILRDTSLSTNPAVDDIFQRIPFTRAVGSLLTQADVSMKVDAFLFISLVLGVLGAVIGAFVSRLPWVGLLVGALVALVPYWVVFRKKETRRRDFERQFPDALDLMTGALRSGMAFTGALQVVAEESPDPVSTEFRMVFEEHRLGLSLRESLEALTERIDSTELRLFVTAVLIQKDTGGNLAEVLEGTAYVIRDRFRILGDVRTITAQARLSGVILTLLPIFMAIFLMIVVPDYLRTLVKDPVGPYLIATAVFLQIVGYIAIRRIVDIKV